MNQIIKTVTLENDRLFIIDQRFLPGEEKILELRDEREVRDAIHSLAVRGAPAIGVAAAYGVYISLKNKGYADQPSFLKDAHAIIEMIASSRPTAYNLFYALDRMRKIVDKKHSIEETLSLLRKEAVQVHEEDIARSVRIAEAGQSVLPEKARVLSHCNAGGLATGGLGTSLSVVYKAFENKKNVFVYVDETRPLLQGSRLTAWELSKVGVPYQVIADNMAAMLMKAGKIDLVLLGADRIARNGDFANKIGTYSLAVLAKHHGVPFYTAAPVSTFDPACADGSDIPIEERDKNEVLGFGGVRTAPEGADAYNPAFDVTPHGLVTGIITEYGVLYPPFTENIARVLQQSREKL